MILFNRFLERAVEISVALEDRMLPEDSKNLGMTIRFEDCSRLAGKGGYRAFMFPVDLAIGIGFIAIGYFALAEYQAYVGELASLVESLRISSPLCSE